LNVDFFEYDNTNNNLKFIMTSKTIQDAKMMQEAMKLKFTYRY